MPLCQLCDLFFFEFALHDDIQTVVIVGKKHEIDLIPQEINKTQLMVVQYIAILLKTRI